MDNGSPFFITTAIDYPNSRPHIGTAFEKIGADVQARFRRMEGDRVHFLMGNDENTIKVPQRARELEVEPQRYVDDMARQFQEVWRRSTSRTTTLSRPARSATTAVAENSSRRSSTPATSTRARIPVTTAPAAKRSRPRRKWRRGGTLPASSRHAPHLGRRGKLLLPALGLSGPFACALRISPGFHPSREPAQRSPEPRRIRAQGHRHHSERF